ncbi:MAG: (2Fe-2S)-binding protein [Acidobacteriales bacterium]|nr:MAG: (2Fe-2S)-binding protein [Terriglobales bacterium]
MTSKKDSGPQEKPGGAVSRRGFIRGVGIAGGAVEVLQSQGQTQPPQPPARVAGPGAVPITLQINGKPYKLMLEPRVTLLDALRDHLDFTGAKRVCDRGNCGACTVIMAGKAVYACSVLAIEAQGKPIQTIEGLASGDALHPISAAFVRNDAQQCGYCTPGLVMATKSLLDRNPSPTLEQVHQELGGNLCRCGTYAGIRKAVLDAANVMRGGKNA